METRMKDAEIIKALELCFIHSDCTGCPCEGSKVDCLVRVGKGAIDLVNRQKAEIDELQLKVKLARDFLDILREGQNEIYQMAMKAKIEAIKEFAERLKETAMQKYDWNECVEVEEVDNLVKEMTEGNGNA